MELRPELMPADPLDEALVRSLVIDLEYSEDPHIWGEEARAALNRLNAAIGYDLVPSDITAVLTNYDPDTWVRAKLYALQIKAVEHVTREELVEVLRRACPYESVDDAVRQTYAAIFDENVPLPGGENLLYWPPPSRTLPIGSYNPTPEQIVDWIFDPDDVSLLS